MMNEHFRERRDGMGGPADFQGSQHFALEPVKEEYDVEAVSLEEMVEHQRNLFREQGDL